jgi:TPP-dependent pyruvate/acetoin dehydrogenase alpha subunit
MYLEKTAILEATDPTVNEILNDYYLAFLSRQLSMLGRREVHNGRAHFGIFGDGKEVAQIAYAKNFRKGDWRSGYYRDQTFMLALGLLQPEEFFSMIYGDTDLNYNPSTGGRNFNNHFSTQNIDENGEIKNLSDTYNSASDISSTAGQMPRLLGLAQASKMVRQNPELKKHLKNNVSGDEVAFGSIGDASTSEGMFFETINAAAVMQLPIAVAVYDDGFGISVPIELQTTKSSISKALQGFIKEKDTNGIEIYTCRGWDYPALIETFARGIEHCRTTQTPVLFHIDEITQPTGHSTSGSHERYKTRERLEWENEFDCLRQFKMWLIDSGTAGHDELTAIEKRAVKRAREARDKAWDHYAESYFTDTQSLETIVHEIKSRSGNSIDHTHELDNIRSKVFPTRRALFSFAKRISYELHGNNRFDKEMEGLGIWIQNFGEKSQNAYSRQLYREGNDSSLKVEGIPPTYADQPDEVTGSEILSRNFDYPVFKIPNIW